MVELILISLFDVFDQLLFDKNVSLHKNGSQAREISRKINHEMAGKRTADFRFQFCTSKRSSLSIDQFNPDVALKCFVLASALESGTECPTIYKRDRIYVNAI